MALERVRERIQVQSRCQPTGTGASCGLYWRGVRITAPGGAEQSRGCNNDVSKNTRNPLLWKGIFYTGGYERRPDEEGIETRPGVRTFPHHGYERRPDEEGIETAPSDRDDENRSTNADLTKKGLRQSGRSFFSASTGTNADLTRCAASPAVEGGEG